MQNHISSEAIQAMEKQQRVHFINSLLGFKSVAMVGTSDQLGQTNLAIFSSFFHIGANPALVGMIFRPTPPERNTFSNIMETGFYTLNHLNESNYLQAHQTSARYDKSSSEFEMTGLQADYKDNFFAPYVKQSHIQLGIQFKEKVDLTINDTTLVIGEILHVYLPDECLSDDGFVHLERANTVTCSGLDSYHTTTQLDRLSYAKPDKPVSSIRALHK